MQKLANLVYGNTSSSKPIEARHNMRNVAEKKNVSFSNKNKNKQRIKENEQLSKKTETKIIELSPSQIIPLENEDFHGF
jgi:hypothetical protein